MSQQFVLVVGDINIPMKAFQIPLQFREIFHPRRISSVILTGNVTSAGTVSFLKTIKPDLHAVRGPYDETSYPEVDTRNYCGYNVSVMSGCKCMPMGNSAQLAKFAKIYDSEIICSGCSWAPFVGMVDNVLVVKPGSLTGSIKKHEPGYADDTTYSSDSNEKSGDSVSSLTDADGANSYIPNPARTYPYVRYVHEPSFILLSISKTSPMVTAFTYIVRDTKLVVSSKKFMVPKHHELPEPRIDMFAQQRPGFNQNEQVESIPQTEINRPGNPALPQQQFNAYAPVPINFPTNAPQYPQSGVWQQATLQPQPGYNAPMSPQQFGAPSAWSASQQNYPQPPPAVVIPAPPPVQPTPVAAPVQPVQPKPASPHAAAAPAVPAQTSPATKLNPYAQAKAASIASVNPYLSGQGAKVTNPYLKAAAPRASPANPPAANPYLKAAAAGGPSPYLQKHA